MASATSFLAFLHTGPKFLFLTPYNSNVQRLFSSYGCWLGLFGLVRPCGCHCEFLHTISLVLFWFAILWCYFFQSYRTSLRLLSSVLLKLLYCFIVVVLGFTLKHKTCSLVLLSLFFLPAVIVNRHCRLRRPGESGFCLR